MNKKFLLFNKSLEDLQNFFSEIFKCCDKGEYVFRTGEYGLLLINRSFIQPNYIKVVSKHYSKSITKYPTYTNFEYKDKRIKVIVDESLDIRTEPNNSEFDFPEKSATLFFDDEE